MRDRASGTATIEAPQDERRQALQRVLQSVQFQNAPLLRGFLEYVSVETIEGRSGLINEYAIATRVFGRRDDFDPTSATIVRTQAYRLRKKLKEYYDSAGAGDELVIEMPKGHYVPRFLPRSEREPDSGRRAVRWRWGWLAATLVALAVVFAAGVVTGRRAAPAEKPPLGPTLTRFWSAMGASGRPVVIGYTNPVFYITENGDLLRPDSPLSGNRGEAVDPNRKRSPELSPLLKGYPRPLFFEDGFTGSGEVIAVQHLTDTLARAGVPFIVKRSRMVTVDDFRNNDVVFLGSQSAYQALDGIALLERFDFERPVAAPLLWRMKIVNRQDRRRSYQLERDPNTQQLRTDYAIFASVPGVVPGRRIVVMGGISTSGTQGAAEFATAEHHMRRLEESLSGKGRMPEYFEAVLRVDAAKGLDAVKSALVEAVGR